MGGKWEKSVVQVQSVENYLLRVKETFLSSDFGCDKKQTSPRNPNVMHIKT